MRGQNNQNQYNRNNNYNYNNNKNNNNNYDDMDNDNYDDMNDNNYNNMNNRNYNNKNNRNNRNNNNYNNINNDNYDDMNDDNYNNMNDRNNNNRNNRKNNNYNNMINNNYDDYDDMNNDNYNNNNNNYNNRNNRNNRNNNNYNDMKDNNNRNYNNRNNNNNYNDMDNNDYNNRNNRNNNNFNNRNNNNYNNMNNNNMNNNNRNNNNYNNMNNNNYNNMNQYNQGDNSSNQRKGKLEYLTSTLTATIIEYTEKHIDNSPVIFYRIKVTDHFNNNSWIIERRYNEFLNLQKKLVSNFPDVPKIPGKTFFRVSDFASIKKRKDGLQYFLKTCINRKDIFASENFKNFLELEKNSPDLCGNSPDLLGNFSLSQGVRDFQYIPEEGIIVLCTAEMNIIERAESKITDLKNKIEKQEEITNPQGFAYVYRVEENNNGEYNYRETWKRKFRARTRSIHYNKEDNYLIIGRTDGFISIHSLDKESRFKKVDLVVELKNHVSDVTGLWYDSVEKKVYSVSADKRFVASDTNYNSQITEINKSPFDYTCLKPDLKYERLFTASEGGVIEIYSFNKFPPTKICSTSITGVGNIKDIYININQFYIFACDVKGKISVLDFGSINNKNSNSSSNSCSEISQFGGKTPLRAIIYDEIKKELITGEESGKIVIWSIKTGQPIFSWAAHESAVTKLLYGKKSRILISGAKDKNIKFWQLPENWVNSDVLKFENEELKKINNEIARRRIKAQQEIEYGIENDFDSDLSQEDDLNGWNYRKDK